MFKKACALLVTLDEKTYMNLIGYYGKAGMIHDGLLLFNKMQEEGIKPGKISYNIMLNVYANAGFLMKQRNFSKLCKDKAVHLTFSPIFPLFVHTQSLKYSEADITINAMQSRGMLPSCAHFNILLSAFMKAGLIDEANRVYKRLSSFGLTPDRICFRTMLKGYLEHGRVCKKLLTSLKV
ncbi:pentatricopeptide repeat-containing protein At5g27270-like isoform X2 [Prosopis cineraria]|nr:pentatricopeptide repeat-containing protein At5g27270-like isoform X2 [Prosopis cineraria]